MSVLPSLTESTFWHRLFQIGSVFAVAKRVEAAIAKFGSGGYSVGKSLTVADIFVFVITTSFVSGIYDGVPQDFFDARFPNLKAVRKTVAAHKGIRAYYAGRTPTLSDQYVLLFNSCSRRRRHH